MSNARLVFILISLICLVKSISAKDSYTENPVSNPVLVQMDAGPLSLVKLLKLTLGLKLVHCVLKMQLIFQHVHWGVFWFVSLKLSVHKLQVLS